MSSAYDFVQKGSLKLKGVAEGGIKKKKKKSKSKNKDRDEKASLKCLATETKGEASTSSSQEKASKNEIDAEKFYLNKTKSEIAFLKKKEQLDVVRIRKKGSETHKERVEKFNAYLNSLSEHYEPAKVSWTK